MSKTARLTILLATINMVVYIVVFVCWVLNDRYPLLTDKLTEFLALPPTIEGLASMPWAPFTYMFSHVSFLHLAVNLLWLIGFGGTMRCQPAWLAATYLSGGLAGSVFYAIYTHCSPFPSAPLIGASASVAAVVVAATILQPEAEVEVPFIGKIKLKWLAIFALISIFGGLSASTVAHLGGIVIGVTFGLTLRKIIGKVRTTSASPPLASRQEFLKEKVATSGFLSLTPSERDEFFCLSAVSPSESTNNH